MTIPNPRTLDSLDGRIILALDKDPEASALALSRTLGVARNTVHARLARLERSGALRSFSRRLDPAGPMVHLWEAGADDMIRLVEGTVLKSSVLRKDCHPSWA